MSTPIRIELDDYRFGKFSIVHVRGTSPSNRVNLDLTIHGVQPGLEPNQYWTGIHLRIRPLEGESGFEIDAEAFGGFRIEDPTDTPDEDQRQYVVAVNGASVLYGILRAEVASMSAHFPARRFLLPTVYMQDIIQKQSAKADGASTEAATPPGVGQ